MTAPSRSQRPEYDPLVDDLSIERRAAQLVVPVLDLRKESERDATWDQARKWLEGLGVGGFILFGGEQAGLKKRLDELKSRPGPAGIAPLVASDLERGLGQQVRGGTSLPPAMALGAAGDEQLARSAGELVAREARAVGIDWLLAPVLDLADLAENPIVGSRAFGADPELVSRIGSAFLRGIEDAGALACAKHFPGHGGTALDSHATLPVVERTRETLEARDLAPFRAALAAQVSSIMTAHVAYPSLASGRKTPATIEKAIVSDLLRKRLNYDGLVVTDALIMSGLLDHTVDEARAAVFALEAGCDVILYPKDPKAVVLAIAAWARTGGQEARLRLNDAVGRVLHAKRSLCLAGPARRASARLAAATRAEEPTLPLPERIAAAALTRAGPAHAPLQPATRTLLVVIDDDGPPPAGPHGAPGAETSPSVRALELVATLEEKLDDLRVVTLGPGATAAERAAAVGLARDVERVVAAVLCRVRAWKNRPGLSPEHAATLAELARAGRPLTVAALCGPLALTGAIPSDAEVLLAYGDEAPCQLAAARGLLGAEARGRPPVPLEGLGARA